MTSGDAFFVVRKPVRNNSSYLVVGVEAVPGVLVREHPTN